VVEIEDNLGRGTVVTLRIEAPAALDEPALEPAEAPPRLTTRQKQVLSLVMELGYAGPSAVVKELSVGLATAHRDLAALEQAGLVSTDGTGKRSLTDRGVMLFDSILK
jgi:Mn-dependent DtxR family transcriptional regulator